MAARGSRHRSTAATDRLEQLHAQLAAGVVATRTSAGWMAWLDTAAKFHNYSFNNQMLIMMQRPTATRVAGFRAWQALDRQVRKGEKALYILAPVITRNPREIPDEQLAREASASPDGKAPQRLVGFRGAAVFDISQTDGEPLPTPPRPELLLGQAPTGLWESLAGLVTENGYTLSRVPPSELGAANGNTHYVNRAIRVRDDLADAQAVKTLAHEVGHMLMHNPDGGQWECRGLAEVEAESVAYLVLAHHGMDTSAYTFDYIAGWASDDDAVRKTADRVLATAKTVIAATSPEQTEQISQATSQAVAAGVQASAAAATIAEARVYAHGYGVSVTADFTKPNSEGLIPFYAWAPNAGHPVDEFNVELIKARFAETGEVAAQWQERNALSPVNYLGVEHGNVTAVRIAQDVVADLTREGALTLNDDQWNVREAELAAQQIDQAATAAGLSAAAVRAQLAHYPDFSLVDGSGVVVPHLAQAIAAAQAGRADPGYEILTVDGVKVAEVHHYSLADQPPTTAAVARAADAHLHREAADEAPKAPQQGWVYQGSLAELRGEPAIHPRPRPETLPAEQIRAVNAAAADWFAAQAAGSQEFAAHARARGHDPAELMRLGVGWAPRRWSELSEHLKTLGFSSAELHSAGLARSRGDGSDYDLFRGRVMFSVVEASGAVAGFTGRDVTGRDGAPKYLNTPANDVYRKKELLFGTQHATSSTEAVVLTEGPWDALAVTVAAQRSGQPIVGLAACGTAITEAHLRLAGGIAESTWLCPDSDDAGIAALGRLIDQIHKSTGTHPLAIPLPGKDPGELMASHGWERVTGAIAERSEAGLVYAARFLDANPPRNAHIETALQTARDAAAHLNGAMTRGGLAEAGRLLMVRTGLGGEACVNVVMDRAAGRPASAAVPTRPARNHHPPGLRRLASAGRR